jgi:translation initiation factor 1 (eIF-1/SUI1)
MNYIKQNSLQNADKPKYLKLDDLLLKTFLKNRQTDPSVTFDELFSIIFSKLSPMHQIKRDDNQEVVTLKKGKFQAVDFKLESRGGNKKVTCVYNLAPFELDQQLLQNKIKKVIGCSVNISETNVTSANSNDYVVCVQGNQIFQVSELLKSIILDLIKNIEKIVSCILKY